MLNKETFGAVVDKCWRIRVKVSDESKVRSFALILLSSLRYILGHDNYIAVHYVGVIRPTIIKKAQRGC